jgi:hypothetical protein
MQLSGRLKATTLGDLLGALFRGRATGTLELVETNERTHRVHVADGLVTAVEVDRACASLGEILQRDEGLDDDTLRRSLLRALASQRLHGEVLIKDFRVSPSVVDRALRTQALLRLKMLEVLSDARVSFHVTMRAPRCAQTDAPLGTSDFLVGRPRARDRVAESGTFPSTSRARAPITRAVDSRRAASLRALGLDPSAGEDEVKQAYRRLVRTLHPDLHPTATAEEKRGLSARFSEVTTAYRALVA